jgi:hypothetical protein
MQAIKEPALAYHAGIAEKCQLILSRLTPSPPIVTRTRVKEAACITYRDFDFVVYGFSEGLVSL